MWPIDTHTHIHMHSRYRAHVHMVEINDKLHDIWFRCTFSMYAENSVCMCKISIIRRMMHSTIFRPNEFYAPFKWWILLHLFVASISCSQLYEDKSTIRLFVQFKSCSHWKCMLNILWYPCEVCFALCVYVYFLNIWFETIGFHLFVGWHQLKFGKIKYSLHHSLNVLFLLFLF